MGDEGPIFQNIAWVDSCDYGGLPEDRRRGSLEDVDPAPLAAFVAAAIGLREDLVECAKVIAKDDRDGPIHLVHLIAACDYAARDVGGSLPTGKSFPELFGLGTSGGILTALISETVLPSLVRTLKTQGLGGATDLARKCTQRERFRALDVLAHYVASPILSLEIDLHDAILIESKKESTPGQPHYQIARPARSRLRIKHFFRRGAP
jgi:hypothetical protein